MSFATMKQTQIIQKLLTQLVPELIQQDRCVTEHIKQTGFEDDGVFFVKVLQTRPDYVEWTISFQVLIDLIGRSSNSKNTSEQDRLKINVSGTAIPFNRNWKVSDYQVLSIQ
ncbi:hypothetical protein ACFLZY_00795 [Patescibacteria group bacterium]